MSLMTRWLCIVLAVCAAPAIMAKGSAEAGATKGAVCAACHGPSGNSSNPLWPTLAGQDASYLSDQIKLFRSSQRINSAGVMTGMTASLSDQDIEDLALYFSQQTPVGQEADPSTVQAGQKLYRGGDRTRNIPACTACHGPVGVGNPAAGYPALRAQHAQYVAKELTDYAGGLRYAKNAKGDSTGGANAVIMSTIAARLTVDDIKSLASFVQGMR
jgi:cytochrome c553